MSEEITDSGFSVENAVEMLRWAGYEVTRKSPPNHWALKKDPSRYRLIESLVNSGASLNEIQRTTGTDPRTIRTYWPSYKPFPVGGGGEAQVIRQVNQDLQRIDEHGIMSTRRGRS